MFSELREPQKKGNNFSGIMELSGTGKILGNRKIRISHRKKIQYQEMLKMLMKKLTKK